MRGSRRRLLVHGLVLSAIVLATANSLVYFTRVDLTERRIHTISHVSRELLEGLEYDVSITYYRSARLVERFPEPREIVDVLEEYAAVSGAVSARFVDPSGLERPEDVEALGIVPQQLTVTEGGERRTAVVYSGVVIEYLDRRAVLPFVFQPETLEYDLTTAIDNLLRDERRYLGLLLGDQTRGVEESYRFVASELARTYEVRLVRPGEIIPDDLDVVLVTDAHRLWPEDVPLLAEYLERGGSVLLTLNAVEVELRNGIQPRAVGRTPVHELAAMHGVTVGGSLLLDESHNPIEVEEVAAGVSVTRSYPYPHWPVVLPRYTSEEHPVTARFPGLDLYWPGTVAVDPDYPGARIIAASTPRAWLMHEPFELNPQRSAQLLRDAEHTRGQYGLVAVSRQQTGPGGRLAVVSDSHFLRDDLLQATGSAWNLEFASSLAHWLSHDERLLEVRTRASRVLTLSAVTDAQREATIRFTARALNVVLLPLSVMLYGAFRLRRRKRRSRVGGRQE